MLGSGLIVLVAALCLAGPAWQQHRLQQARNCLENRQLAQARQWLDAALHRDPDSGEALLLLARLERREGRLSNARDYLQRAWKAGVSPARLERQQWLALAQAGQLDEAEPHLNELLSDPQGEAAEICEAFLNGYLRAYRFDDALRLLDAWQADFPADPQPRIYRGMVFEHLMMTGKAIEEYEAACRLDPARLEAHLRLADQLAALLRDEQALAHYQICLDADPRHPEARLGYASCLLKQGQVEQPEQIFRQVLADNPGNRRARAGLAQLTMSAGKYDEAVAVLQELVAEQPTDRAWRYQLATALQTSGRADEARPHFEFVTAANQAMARAQGLLEQLRTEPARVDLRFDVGSTLLQYGSASEGVAWLQSVLQLEPDHRAAHEALAAHYESQDQPELAARHRRQAGS
ncbi:MAG: tetratricopeptide repeat protein [Pirellulaceae bacterium]|nr:tetratricopeptide repeat protein [Pirellulaceae bacterium]